ncbi:MAG: hybrid sensor histidine kinase/response regulator [Deltaproteobacteria bacterium]|nr:hybrid sensor histidine kinase/response regulator [Deltaproteobacteria bacterium]
MDKDAVKKVLQARSPKILMVDDEASNLQVVRLILTRENLARELIMFNQGQEALEYLENNTVDLILLDLAMPGMNGFEVLERIKSNPANQEVPVIFLSAYQDTEYIIRAFEMGANDFIGKPIISPILTARIESLLQTQTLKQELQKQFDALDRTSRLKDELMSIASHDLRSPLSAIELLCQFMSDALAGKGEHQPEELVGRILNQSRLSRRLVENLLNLNRIEEGILIPSRSFFKPEDLIRECLEDEKPIMEGRGLGFFYTPFQEGLICHGDRELMAQVIRNIMGNAIKFARSRVSMDVTALDVSGETGGELVVHISDDGEGISEPERGKIFEKYQKGDRRGIGSGLGLFIARQVVELHHGSINVESTLGEYTRFTFRVPNLFRLEDLPDMSEYQDLTVRIISGLRSDGEMLGSVLEEAGLVDVMVLPAEQESFVGINGEQPGLLIIDFSTGNTSPETLAGWTGSLSKIWPVLAFAPKTLFDAFKDSWGGNACQVEPPLNPLLLLNCIKDVLK